MENIKFRFEIMDFGEEVEKAYKDRLLKEKIKKEEEKIKKEHEWAIECSEYRRKIEEKGICEGCGKKNEECRWIRNEEFYVCYDCFIKDLKIEGSLMVPIYRAEDMNDYMR